MPGRKKLDRISLHARVAPGTPEKLKEIAQAFGFTYDNHGSTGQMLDAIAEGKLILLPTKNSAK
jgi:hypothetical protein